jgi:hypothetical protein
MYQRTQRPSSSRRRRGRRRLSVAGATGRQVQHDAQLAAATVGPQRLQRQAVAEQQVVRHLHRGGTALQARREDAPLVAEHGHHPGLVVGGDGRHAVAQLAHVPGVVDEALHRVAVRPAALVLQGLRQVPVVQRQVGLHAAREQAVDQALVEGQAGAFQAPWPSGCTRGQDTEKR